MDRSNQHSDSGSPAKELIDFARQQTAHATKIGLAQPPSLPPDCIPGYTLEREIRRGGQGTVFEAVQASTRQPVAVKILRNSSNDSRGDAGRFRREVEVLSRFQHPNIVRLIDGGCIDGRRFLVMEYVAGTSLDAHIVSEGLGIREIVQLFVAVCDAVNAAHVRGIVHRDLKPSNVLVDEGGSPHVLDFGLAKLIERPNSEHLTVTGEFVGSLLWSSPEQVEAHPDGVDMRTDVYSLGLMLFHAMTGEHPYEVGGSPRRVMENIATAEPLMPSSVGVRIDADLETILAKCLKKSPNERYQTAGELGRELQRYLLGDAIEARRDSTLYVLTKAAKRHRIAVAMGLAVVVLVLGWAITTTVLLRRAVRAEQQAQAASVRERERAAAQRETLGFVVDEVSGKLKELPGASFTQKAILQGAYDRLLALTEDRANPDPEARPAVASVEMQLGDIAHALGELQTAADHFDRAIVIREGLVSSHPDRLEWRADLSISIVRKGDVVREIEEDEHGRAYYERAIAIDESLVKRSPDERRFLENLCWSYERNGFLAGQRGEYGIAHEQFTRQLAAAESLVRMDPLQAGHLRALMRSLRQLYALAIDMDDFPQASDWLERLLKSFDGYEAHQGTPSETYSELAHHMHWTATQLERFARYKEAEELYHRALAAVEKSDAGHGVPRNLDTLIRVHDDLASLAAARRQDVSVRLQHVRTQFELAEQLARLEPNTARSIEHLFTAACSMASALRAIGNTAEASVYAERALRDGEQLLARVQGSQGSVDFQVAFAAFLALNAPAGARDARPGVRLLEALVADPQSAHPVHVILLAELYHAAGEHEKELETLIELQTRLPKWETHKHSRIDALLESCGAKE